MTKFSKRKLSWLQEKFTRKLSDTILTWQIVSYSCLSVQYLMTDRKHAKTFVATGSANSPC